VKPKKNHFKNILITAVSLTCAFCLSLAFQHLDVEEHVTTLFVFAVFLISLLTDGYLYGILAAIAGTIAVNYAFTFPYFAINFTIPVNLVSSIIMVAIAVLTCALTTKLKNHEAMKAESEKERMRANLLRAVSHDLRTPLTTIYGSSTTLLDSGDAMSPAQKEKILAGIKEDSQWLIRMVENLLSVTRIDGGHVRIVKTPTVLEELIDSVILKFKKRYPAQKVDIQLPEEVVILPMDAMLIEQVLINLLENAVQHAYGMTQLSLQVTASDGQAVFQIRDNGCGIDPKRLETVFAGENPERGKVADGQKKNAGIGLSVCATIIKAHGGVMRAENSKQGGAVIQFTLDTEEISHDSE